LDSGSLAADLMYPGSDDTLTLIESSYDSDMVPLLLNAAHDLVYLAGHGNYNGISTGDERFKAGDHATYGDTAALDNLANAVIVTSGCHNGVSFGNHLYHAPDAGTTYSDFPEEFGALQVGVYVAATGITNVSLSGDDTSADQVIRNERLATYVIQHLIQDGNITAGEAFRRAVNSYVSDSGSIGAVQRRVIAITTLYGIPNYRAPLQLSLQPSPVEYALEPTWVDPPPCGDPALVRYLVQWDLRHWDTVYPGGGPDWYLRIQGASFNDAVNGPLLPVIKSEIVLPPGSTIIGVEWDRAASESTSWVASGPLYSPPAGEEEVPWSVPSRIDGGQIDQITQLYGAYTTTSSGGAGTVAGLGITPLLHDSGTLSTTLWTKLVFTVTVQAGPSGDTDGDGLPDYWEASRDLDLNDPLGDQGANGDPDQDDLENAQEFLRGLDPQDPDTDNDGWSDWAEIGWGTDPLNPGSHPVRVYLPVLWRG
jgi:hypothetical protein